MSDTAPAGPEKIWVGLELNPTAAKMLAIPGGESPSDLHITLVIVDDWGYSLKNTLNAVMEAVGEQDMEEDMDTEMVSMADSEEQTDLLTGITSGLARFNASENSNGLDVVVALVQIEDLCELRCKITDELDEMYVSYKDDFEYTPHITLKYISPSDDLPIQSVPNVGLIFDKIVVKSGTSKYFIPLGDGDIDVELNVYVTES